MTLSHTPIEASVFAASASAQWVPYDLLTNKGVPMGAVAAIVIRNGNTSSERTGGVRKKGSGLERKIDLHEAEGGGYTTCAMLVKTDSSDGTIEVYAENAADTDFVLLGYFEDCDFIEAFDDLGWASAAWVATDLSGYGVPANAVLQIMCANRTQGSVYFAGVREVGSSLERSILLDEAEGATTANNLISMIVKADANSIIERKAGVATVRGRHHILGWFGPTVDFTEGFSQVIFSGSKIDNQWESRTLTYPPANAIVAFAMVHQDSKVETLCGLREEGSALNRYILEHEAEGGGETGFMACVTLDASRKCEIYCADASESLFFYMGYFGVFVVRKTEMAEVFGEFEIRKDSSEDLFSEFEVEVRRTDTTGSANLPAAFEVGQGWMDLPASFLVDPLGSGGLYSEFVVRHVGTPIELLGEFIIQHETSVNLPAEFIIRHETSVDLDGEFTVRHDGWKELSGEFITRHSDSEELPAEFIVRHETSEELLSGFRVRCPRRMGSNWQRKIWFDGTYYWRGRCDPVAHEIIFEYITAAGLTGNVWTINANASIGTSGFAADRILADFTVRGGESGVPTTIHYSDGEDTWIAESDESSLTGWFWENLTKVFDATPSDWYRRVNLCANRTTPIPRLWVTAVFYDNVSGKQWVKAREQTTGGNLLNWDGEVPVSNVDNTATIYGESLRSMGDAGLLKDDILFVYKEGAALRSRYYDGDWDAPIVDIDITTIGGHSSFDLEHGEVAGENEGHLLYVDADYSIKWRERDPGAGSAWTAAEELHGPHGTHHSVGIIEHGSDWLWLAWTHIDEIEYRLHLCTPETWWPLLANPALTFDPTTSPPAVVTTTTVDQLQTPDVIPAGSAIPICWIGQTGIGVPCEPGWGILIPDAQEDLPAEFIVLQDSEDLPGEFIVRHADFAELLGIFEVGQGWENLPAAFDSQGVSNLPAEFSVIRYYERLLPAEFIVLQDSEDLPGEFISRLIGSQPLLGIFNIVHSIALAAGFEVRHSDSEELLGTITSRHTGTPLDLSAKFFVANTDGANLPAGFTVQHTFTGEGVIIAEDPWDLLNVRKGIGTGFLEKPMIGGPDAEHKVSGTASYRFQIGYQSDRHDYIVVGYAPKTWMQHAKAEQIYSKYSLCPESVKKMLNINWFVASLSPVGISLCSLLDFEMLVASLPAVDINLCTLNKKTMTPTPASEYSLATAVT